MDKVYQVVEGLYFIGESQETIFGTYSTQSKAEERLDTIRQYENVCSENTFIREIELNIDKNSI